MTPILRHLIADPSSPPILDAPATLIDWTQLLARPTDGLGMNSLFDLQLSRLPYSARLTILRRRRSWRPTEPVSAPPRKGRRREVALRLDRLVRDLRARASASPSRGRRSKHTSPWLPEAT